VATREIHFKIRARLSPALAGRLINEIRDLAVIIEKLPSVDVSPDSYDNYLLSIASGGRADFLVTGDKNHLLALKKHDGSLIVTVSDFFILTGTR
jgi:predicted nucleic acid-binding protein